MLNYFKHINDILLLNLNKYLHSERLYKKFKNIIKDGEKDKNMEYLYLLHLMTYKKRLENHFVKVIRDMNNNVSMITPIKKHEPKSGSNIKSTTNNP